MARCVELGHALGNQHWAAVVKGMRVYVPLAVARAVMASVMKTHAFKGVTYAFVPGAEVIRIWRRGRPAACSGRRKDTATCRSRNRPGTVP